MPPAEKKDLSPPGISPASAMITSTLETVIIFDWDDTLLASSFLSGKGYRLDNNLERSAELECQLKELEQSVVHVLTLALGFGAVHIVTNAETGWVQMSAQKWIPGVVPLLSKVAVISARSTYESQYPEAPLKWKYFAFQQKLNQTFAPEAKSEKNVISFGDSYVEREAVRAVTKGMSNTRTKSVKFAERPSMEQLRRQIELVSNCFQYIYNHDGDLDLQLTVTVSSSSPPNSQPSSPTAGPTGPAMAVAPIAPIAPPVLPAAPPVPPSPSQRAVQMASVPTTPSNVTRLTPPTTPTHVPYSAPLVSPSTPKLVPKSPAHAPGTPRSATQAVHGLIFGAQSAQAQSSSSSSAVTSGSPVQKPAPITLPPPQSPLKHNHSLHAHSLHTQPMQTVPLSFVSSAVSHHNHSMSMSMSMSMNAMMLSNGKHTQQQNMMPAPTPMIRS